MHCLTRPAFIVAVLLGASIINTIAPAQAVANALGNRKGMTGSISGRITVNGKGARGVVVILRLLRSNGPRSSFLKVRTDDDGHFRFNGLAAGQYAVFPFALALVNPSAGLMGDNSKLVNIIDGEAVEGINFALVRGGVITGRVTDADGRPVIAKYVKLTIVDERGQRRSDLAGYQSHIFETDDRGIYRIYGLPAGHYLVSLGIEKDSADVAYSSERAYYTRTFHPNVTDESKAEIVTLSEGGEATGIDITLGRPLPTYSASGRIVDTGSGKPVPNIIYGYGALAPNVVGLASVNYGERSTFRGEFRIEGLAPGRFAIITDPEGQSGLYSEPLIFEIADKDVTGLEVKLYRGATISGVVVIEGMSDETFRSQLSGLRLAAYANAPEDLGTPRAITSSIAADGSFRLNGLRPGKMNFYISGPARKGFSLARVERDGIEQREGLDVAPAAQITGVRVHIAYGTGAVRGQVKVTGGALPENVRLYVYARSIEGHTGVMADAGVDTRGHFVIENLVAGDYELTLEVSYYSDSASPMRPHPTPPKQTVKVTNAVDTEVTFVLDLSAGSEPQ